jgi:alpha-D-ribose 1-methylphosphonate 5-triphosphate diphosphatase
METIYTNAVIITRDEIVHGTLVVENGFIKDIDTLAFKANNAINIGGDFLLAGLIEIHTDNLEKNIQPRPGVIWPSILSAALAHDSQIAGAGITTVFDAVAVGGMRQGNLRAQIFDDCIGAFNRGKTMNIFKADHYLHFRCEVSDSKMGEILLKHSNSDIRLISLMDHTPGQRQWADLEKWRLYHRDKLWSDDEAETIRQEHQQMQERYSAQHRKLAISVAAEKNIPLASHDDTSPADIQTALAEGISISEFPTTLAAAHEAKNHGMRTIMGAPNAVRGVSHSGNISAVALAQHDLLDGLSSDYVPSSLLHAAFSLAEKLQKPLHQAVNMVTVNIAEMTGFSDRGELAPGKRADMVQVKLVDGIPLPRKVWKKGMRIA